jgi:hypothetical protein
MNFIKNNDVLILEGIKQRDVSTFEEFVGSNAINIWTEISVINANTKAVDITTYMPLEDLKRSNQITVAEYATSLYQYEINSGSLIIDTPNILRSFGYISGEYTVNYKFYYNILGDSSFINQVYIDKISPSRKELMLGYSNDSLKKSFTSISDTHFYQRKLSFRFDKFLNFGNGSLISVVNAKNEYDDSTKSDKLIVKLYDKLPVQIKEKSLLWVVKLISDEIIQNVTLLSDIVEETNYVLKGPNFKSHHRSEDVSSYQNYDSIVPTINSLKDLYMVDKNNSDGSTLYVDYSNFSSFSKFGSALNRLQNFKKKVLLLESYDAKISETPIDYGFAQSSSLVIVSMRDELLSNLTNYEKFLYFDYEKTFTSSLYSGSLIDATWPKLSTNPTISLAPWNDSITSSVYQWYTTMSVVSADYDYNNVDILSNTLPSYIQIDKDSNSDYFTLLNSIGEMYDYIYTYIRGLETLHDKGNNSKLDGVPNDLTWNLLKNVGLDMINGSDIVNISDYGYGLNVSSSIVSKSTMSAKDVTEEIWNRLSNNYMYLYKSKGTSKAIYSLLNCYGIPSNLVQIREFGGPYASADNQVYVQQFTDFTHVIEFTSSAHIKIPWIQSIVTGSERFPDSIELKFRTTEQCLSMSLLEIESEESPGYGVKLNVNHVNNEYGYLSLDLYTPSSGDLIITSSTFPLLNGEYYNVMLNRGIASDSLAITQSYHMTVVNYDEYLGKISINNEVDIQVSSSDFNSCYSTSGSIYLGGYNDNKFVGSMDEFRLWNEILEPDIFQWHAKYSTATNGNGITSSIDTLIFRLSFNYPQNLYVTQSILNDTFHTSSYASSALAVGFLSMSQDPYNFSYYERSNTLEHRFLTPTSYNSNKIRIENNSIQQLIKLPDGNQVRPLKSSGYQAIIGYNLNYVDSNGTPIFNEYTSAIEIVGEVGEYDNADPDTDRLLIGFTPTEFINNDIIAFYGTENLSNSYGDYQYINSDHYGNEFYMKDFYFDHTKNVIDLKTYIKYLQYFDKSVFDTVKQFVPIKTNPIIGLVYEENILHRNKVQSIKRTKFDNFAIPLGTFDVSPDITEFNFKLFQIQEPVIQFSKNIKMKASKIGFESNILKLTYNIISKYENLYTTIQYTNEFEIQSDIYSNLKIKLDSLSNGKIYASDISEIAVLMANEFSSIKFENLSKYNKSFAMSPDVSVSKYTDTVSTYINSSSQETILGKRLDYVIKDIVIDRMRRDYSVKRKEICTFNKAKLDANEYNFQGYDSFLWKSAVHTSADTLDRTPIIQLWKNNPNTLKVNYFDNPKLIVDK